MNIPPDPAESRKKRRPHRSPKPKISDAERAAKKKAARKARKAKRSANRAANPRQKRSSAAEPFYRSRAWKTLRYEALRRYGAVCKCCGATPQDGYVMNADHIKPRWRHPELELDIENIQILCASCNAGKWGLDETDWRTW